MAAPARILSLNVGSQTVALGDFRTQAQGGLVLAGYRLRELVAEPGNEETRNLQIAGALWEMMREFGIKDGAVNYGVPRNRSSRAS